MGISSSPSLQAIYKEVLGDYADHKEFLWKHRGRFVHYVQTSVDVGLLDSGFNRKHFRLEKLSYVLDPSRDRLLTPQDVAALTDGHLLRGDSGLVLETPQYFWMRLAMVHSANKPNPTREALVLYDQLSLKPGQALKKYAIH